MKKKFLIAFLVVISCFACVFGVAACTKKPNNSDNGTIQTPPEEQESDGDNGTIQTSPEEKPDKPDNPTEDDKPAAVVEITSVFLNKTSTSMFIGDSEKLTVTVLPSNATEQISWLSASPSVATVENGTITAVTEGKATIIASSPGGKTATCEVTVTENDYGLVFEDYGDGWAVAGYKGSETKITVPAKYKGRNVVAIGTGKTNASNFPIADGFTNCKNVTDIILPDTIHTINYGAFTDCSSLTELVIPDSVTYIGSYTFYNCSGLTSITIPDSVTSISDSAFYGCSGLTSITIPFIGDSVKTSKDMYQYPFGYIFGTGSYTGSTGAIQSYYGNSLSSTTNTTYYIPASLKSVTVTGGNVLYGAFYGCSGLTSVTIGDSVTSIGDSAFKGCSGLTSVTIPNSVTSIGDSAFYNCSRLTNVTIPNSVTMIYSAAFRGCSGLTSVTIPDSVTSIGGSAFYNCSGLTCITIPDGVTTINAYTFYNCSGLTSITIPDSVTSIGKFAFYCYGEFVIHFSGTFTQWSKIHKETSWGLGYDVLYGRIDIPK